MSIILPLAPFFESFMDHISIIYIQPKEEKTCIQYQKVTAELNGLHVTFNV